MWTFVNVSHSKPFRGANKRDRPAKSKIFRHRRCADEISRRYYFWLKERSFRNGDPLQQKSCAGIKQFATEVQEEKDESEP